MCYITQLRGQLTAAQKQLEPFADIAKKLYPDADQATALHSVSEQLQTLVVRAPAAPAAQDVANAAPPPPSDFLTAAQEDAIANVLRNEADTGKKAWFLVAQSNREASSAQAELQKVFEKAGWPVQVERAPYPVKAGIFLLAATRRRRPSSTPSATRSAPATSRSSTSPAIATSTRAGRPRTRSGGGRRCPTISPT